MKKIIFAFASLILLISCSGSDSYQGRWKAVDASGKKFEIDFTPKKFTVRDSAGTAIEYSYTQHQYQYDNGVQTYGITLKDGRGYQIYFPKGSGTIGLLKDENGQPVYTLSRKNYMTYQDIYKLK